MTVLDTNVLSELTRLNPAAAVRAWFASRTARDLYVTSVTKAEILHGIGLMPRGRKRDGLERAAEEMFAREFEDRVLPFDFAAADVYARIVVNRRAGGRPISAFDAQIASITAVAGGILATRNLTDFEGCGIELVDPWEP